MDKAQCKACKQDKVKIMVKAYAGGAYRYEDENGNGWFGGVCGDCRADFKRERYSQNPLDLTNCKICTKKFDKKADNHLYCSKACKTEAKKLRDK